MVYFVVDGSISLRTTPGVSVLFFLIASCTTPEPVVPYTAEECRLAREFETTCMHRNLYGAVDDNGDPFDFSGDRPFEEIVRQRDALGVQGYRHWWCNDPSSDNDYQYTPRFTPSIDTCPALRQHQ